MTPTTRRKTVAASAAAIVQFPPQPTLASSFESLMVAGGGGTGMTCLPLALPCPPPRCSPTDTNSRWCGGFDTADFGAFTMCCACGGGTTGWGRDLDPGGESGLVWCGQGCGWGGPGPAATPVPACQPRTRHALGHTGYDFQGSSLPCVSESNRRVAFASAASGNTTDTCGSAQTPCGTIQIAAVRAGPGGVVAVDCSGGNFTNATAVYHSITIVAHGDCMAIVDMGGQSVSAFDFGGQGSCVHVRGVAIHNARKIGGNGGGMMIGHGVVRAVLEAGACGAKRIVWIRAKTIVWIRDQIQRMFFDVMRGTPCRLEPPFKKERFSNDCCSTNTIDSCFGVFSGRCVCGQRSRQRGRRGAARRAAHNNAWDGLRPERRRDSWGRRSHRFRQLGGRREGHEPSGAHRRELSIHQQ